MNFPEEYHQGGRALNSVAAEAEILFKIPEVEAGERAKNSLSHFSTFTNANKFCLDPEKASPAMIILPLVALEDQFGAEMKKLGIRF